MHQTCNNGVCIFAHKIHMTKMHMYMYMYIKTRIEEGQDAICILQHTETQCITLQQTATHCNTLQQNATQS